MKDSVASQLAHAQTLIHNAVSNPRLQERLKDFGYTPPRMQEASNLLKNVQSQQNEKEALYSRQKEVGRQLQAEMKTLKFRYQEHLALARYVFRHDSEKQNWLELNGTRKSSVADYLNQVEKFYTRITPLLPLLKKHGAATEEFTQCRAQVEAVIALRQQRVSGKGEAEHATLQRNQALQELNVWISSFKQVARAAFRQQPQLLESLGIRKGF